MMVFYRNRSISRVLRGVTLAAMVMGFLWLVGVVDFYAVSIVEHRIWGVAVLDHLVMCRSSPFECDYVSGLDADIAKLMLGGLAQDGY